MHAEINRSIRDCLCSRATSRLIVCIRNVQMIMSAYDFLKSQVLSCWRKVESVCDIVILWQSVPDTGSSNRGPWTPGHRLLNVWQMAPSDENCPITPRIAGFHKMTRFPAAKVLIAIISQFYVSNCPKICLCRPFPSKCVVFVFRILVIGWAV